MCQRALVNYYVEHEFKPVAKKPRKRAVKK